MVGGDYIPREIDALADDGRIVMIAVLGGAKGTVDLGQVLRRRLTLTGSTLRPRPVAFKAAIAARLREKVWPLLEAGKIKPVIHASFPLEQAAQAHALMESSAHIGKIVLTVDGLRAGARAAGMASSEASLFRIIPAGLTGFVCASYNSGLFD